jgi:hypothetical protein
VFVDVAGGTTLQATLGGGEEPPEEGEAVSAVLPPDALRVLRDVPRA